MNSLLEIPNYTDEIIKDYDTSISSQTDDSTETTPVQNLNYTYLTSWLAFRNGVYYMSSDILFQEVCKHKELIMSPEETIAVEQILEAVIQADPDSYSSDKDYRLRLILNGSGTECRLIDSQLFTRNNGGNIWKSKNPEPNPTPDLTFKNSDITVEVKAYGSENLADIKVKNKRASNTRAGFYNASFVCARLIKDTPQRWLWYKKVNGYYRKCKDKPEFLDQNLDLQPEICKVSYDYSTGHKCLKISIS